MRASAPGKVMLTGEYIAIEGHSSLLVAVDRYATAIVGREDPAPGRRSWCVESPNASLAGVNALCESLRLSGWYTVDTGAFLDPDGTKLGLGSSAAALASLAALAAPHLSATERFLLARDAHNRSQQEVGSGADVASSTFGGLLHYKREPFLYEELQPNRLGVSLVCVETGLAASTPNLVRRVFAHRETAAVSAIFSSMAGVTDEALISLRGAQRDAFLSALSRYGYLVRSLGEATATPLWLECHSQAERIAQSLGGCAKPTGAGGGDLILIAIPVERERMLRDTLRREGLRALDLRLSLHGAQPSDDHKTAPLIL